MIPPWVHIVFIAVVVTAIAAAIPIVGNRERRLRAEDKARSDAAWLAQVDDWNQPNPPHRGPCRCDGCVISDQDDPATHWNKALRQIGLDS